MKIILPKTRVEIDPNYGPLFYLMGPIRGGGDWQRHCCRMIESRIPNFYAAVPCRWTEFHPLYKYGATGTPGAFARQLNWERYYIELAAKTGCLLFWLPAEHHAAKHPGPEPYAMDTRGELGEWRGRMMHERGQRVVIGGEPAFHGMSQIQRNFSLALGYEFPIYPSLDATITAAIAALSPTAP
ncbi:MAG: hypothetical protein WC866_01695 [Patescibacteria group bacterium]